MIIACGIHGVLWQAAVIQHWLKSYGNAQVGFPFVYVAWMLAFVIYRVMLWLGFSCSLPLLLAGQRPWRWAASKKQARWEKDVNICQLLHTHTPAGGMPTSVRIHSVHCRLAPLRCTHEHVQSAEPPPFR